MKAFERTRKQWNQKFLGLIWIHVIQISFDKQTEISKKVSELNLLKLFSNSIKLILN